MEKYSNATKYIVRIAAIILVLAVTSLIFLAGCCDYITKHSVVKDIDRYGKYDDYVNEQLKENFCGSMPQKIPMDCKVMDYLYDYDSPLLDLPSFHIGLELHFSKSAFALEYERVTKIENSTVFDCKSETIVILSNHNDIEEYCNDQICDGHFLYFEIVCFDKNSNNVRYIVAKVSDAVAIDSSYMNIINMANNCLKIKEDSN